MRTREKRAFWGLENWGFGGANVLLWRGGFEGREEGLEGRGLGRVGQGWAGWSRGCSYLPFLY